VRINSYEVVLVFELDETIVLSLGPSLKTLQRKLGGKLITINAPEDAPPPLPRIILKLSDSVLKLAIDRISISINPPSHVQSNINKSSKFALQRTISMVKELLATIPQYKWCGIITGLEFPSKQDSYRSGIEATTPVSDKLINIDRSDKELASFQLQYGIKENSYFATYTIMGYESRDIKLIPKNKKGSVTIGADDYQLTECGIRIMLDINNRPGGATEDPINDIENILNKTNELSNSIPTDLNLEGILT
jgi:hypothetical protein